MPTPRNSSLRPGGKSASNWSSKRPSARMSLVQDEFPSATVVAMLPHSNNPGQNPAWIHLRNLILATRETSTSFNSLCLRGNVSKHEPTCVADTLSGNVPATLFQVEEPYPFLT